MKVQLGEKELRYLREQDRTDVTLDLEEIPSNCCVGRLPEVKIHHCPPQNPGHYRHFTVHGIHIHVSKLLRTQDTLTFCLSGFGPFKKLGVKGLNLIL